MTNLPLEQHSVYQWVTKKELLGDNQVHIYTKWYFHSKKQADFDWNSGVVHGKLLRHKGKVP